MHKGKSDLGMRKHRISGTIGPNRRALQLRAAEQNKLDEAKRKKKPKAPLYSSIAECMKKESK